MYVKITLNTFKHFMKIFMMIMIIYLLFLTDKRRLVLFPVRTIVRDPHHRKSPERCEQDLNMRKTLVQTLLDKVVQD